MEVERKLFTFDIDDSLTEKVEALTAEGWQIEEGKTPQITYELVRLLQSAPATMGVGRLVIDDSKVMVIKAGE